MKLETIIKDSKEIFMEGHGVSVTVNTLLQNFSHVIESNPESSN